MYRLQILGGIDLTADDGRRVGSVLNQPKRLALLSMLAMESPKRMRRDEVIGRLWPETDDASARKSLRQSLSFLRRSLGPKLMLGDREEAIGIDPEVLSCDASDFLEAFAEERFDSAMALYSGEFLQGFHLDDAPAPFEYWLSETRRRFRQAAAEAGRHAANGAADRGDRVGAAIAARWSCEVGGWGEAAVQELLRLLVRIGDDGGARDAYRDFADRLEQEYGTEPTAETREILRGLDEHADGDQPETVASDSAAPEVLDLPVPTAPVPATSRRPRMTTALAVFVGLVGVVGVVSIGLIRTPPPPVGHGSADSATRIYLDPVRDVRGAESGLGAAIGSRLAAEISRTGGVHVFLDPDHDAEEQAGFRLQPLLRADGTDLVLAVTVLDAPSHLVLGRIEVRAPGAGEQEATAAALAHGMTRSLRGEIGPLRDFRLTAGEQGGTNVVRLVRHATMELETAKRLRSEGAHEMAVSTYEIADSMFGAATDLEPDWVALRIARAEAVLWSVTLYQYPPIADVQRAREKIMQGVEDLDAAIAITPDHAGAHAVRGRLTYWLAMIESDHERHRHHIDEAETFLARAVELNPGLGQAWNLRSAIAERRGAFESAYHHARRAQASDFEYRPAPDLFIRLSDLAFEVGDLSGGRAWCRELEAGFPGAWLGPYCHLRALAWAGPWSSERSDSLREAGLSLMDRRTTADVHPSRFDLLHAVVLARGGDRRGAVAILQRTDLPDPTPLELLDLEAWVWAALDEAAAAEASLHRVYQIDPEYGRGLLLSRRYRNLIASPGVIERPRD